MEQNTDIVNEPREEIVDTDLAVGLAENGFHVYLDNTDRQLTFEKIYDYFDDYGRLKDGHTFTVPMMEVAQFGALETLCEKFESFNDEVRADGGLRGLSLEDYADELLDDEESHFEWRNGQSEWENVRRSILSGETKFLHPATWYEIVADEVAFTGEKKQSDGGAPTALPPEPPQSTGENVPLPGEPSEDAYPF